MRRREFLTSATATVTVASIAGCSDILGDDDDGSSGPESAVENYADAINSNDPEQFEAAFHPDASDTGETPTQEEMEQVSMSVESSEVVEGPEDGVAIVEVEFEITVEQMGQEQTTTTTPTMEVRTHDGEWKLYGDA